MIKAIIFDCFGVLVNDSWLSFKDRYFHDQPQKYDKASELNYLSDTGKISYEEFLTAIADLAGQDRENTKRLIDNNPPNLALLSYIRDSLKPHYKIGLLSNAADDWLGELFTPDELQLFDASLLSYQYSFAKPDPRIYAEIARQLAVISNECVFIDDIERYCHGAESAGMQTIWYQGFEQLKSDLNKLLSSPDN